MHDCDDRLHARDHDRASGYLLHFVYNQNLQIHLHFHLGIDKTPYEYGLERLRKL